MPPRFRRYSREQLAAAVASSTSKRQVLLKLGVIAEGGNYRTISGHIRSLSLDTSHFTGQASRRGDHRTFVPTERYLNNEVPIGSHSLKLRLLKEGILQRVCASCGLDTWLGELIPIELDHRDGNHANNRLENLRLLCPNCHALTPTYRGRNKGNLVGLVGLEPTNDRDFKSPALPFSPQPRAQAMTD